MGQKLSQVCIFSKVAFSQRVLTMYLKMLFKSPPCELGFKISAFLEIRKYVQSSDNFSVFTWLVGLSPDVLKVVSLPIYLSGSKTVVLMDF